ncbi:MAG TPA: TfoX/Sxy family protein [Candidatus Edwardsbacteria bacterium]|nr:TfoX/Sxy family protein [Candidatus Edwardsbacteria bacterium]
MPYDADIERMALAAAEGTGGLEPRKMFGGICCLLHGNMAFGVWKDNLIVRLGSDEQALALIKANKALPFDITGRRMKGWAMVPKPLLRTAADYRHWVGLGIGFARSLPAK